MLAADVERAVEVTAAAFGRDLGDVAAARRWRERIAYPCRTDPDGAFVAEFDGRVIGVAEAIVRERLWCLSMLAVEPGIQSGGAGRALLERALAYGRATEAGLLVSSNDPRALRLYADSGFALHPTFEAEGIVDRRRLPRQNGAIRDDGGTDLEALAGLTRASGRALRACSATRPDQGALDHRCPAMGDRRGGSSRAADGGLRRPVRPRHAGCLDAVSAQQPVRVSGRSGGWVDSQLGDGRRPSPSPRRSGTVRRPRGDPHDLGVGLLGGFPRRSASTDLPPGGGSGASRAARRRSRCPRRGT